MLLEAILADGSYFDLELTGFNNSSIDEFVILGAFLTATMVPEPSSLAFTGLALGGLAVAVIGRRG